MPKKKKTIFDLIAPIYGLYFNSQKKYYQKILTATQSILDAKEYKTILDIGCGTGALCAVLAESGLKVTGVDASAKMLEIARNKTSATAIHFIMASILETIPFADKSFDMAIASYVAHGLSQPARKLMYAEMSRLTKHKIIFHDFNTKRKWTTDVAEWLEGGDYFYFIQHVKAELLENFQEVQVIEVDDQAAWYVCTPRL